MSSVGYLTTEKIGHVILRVGTFWKHIDIFVNSYLLSQ